MVERVTLRVGITLACAAWVLASGSAVAAVAAPKRTLQAFASDEEISHLFKRWGERRRLDEESRRKESAASSPPMATLSAAGVMQPAPASAPAAKAADQAAE